MPISKDNITEKTPQYIQNLSFDKDFDVPAAELIGYDSDAGVLRRVKCNSDGELEVTT